MLKKLIVSLCFSLFIMPFAWSDDNGGKKIKAWWANAAQMTYSVECAGYGYDRDPEDRKMLWSASIHESELPYYQVLSHYILYWTNIDRSLVAEFYGLGDDNPEAMIRALSE